MNNSKYTQNENQKLSDLFQSNSLMFNGPYFFKCD